MKRIVKLTATFFYLGYSPFIPGTLGSLVGVMLYLGVKDNLFFYLGGVIFLTIVGFWSAGEAERILQVKDSKKIIIDEIWAMVLCFFLIPFTIKNLICGFLIFRIFDIIKPYPARRWQKLNGSLGIMLDDFLAAIYTNLILRVLNSF